MSQVADVARVLLVAHTSRQRELAGWLRVEGEEVSYELRLATPETVSFEELWDVVVLDGESLFDDERRLELMRRFGERPRDASILFVCSRLPHERELADAAVWLAPWRRSSALRRRAEAAGDAHLRVLRGSASTQARLASEAFNEGRRIAVVDMRERVDRACEGLLAEVLDGFDCPDAVRSIEDQYHLASSPAVAARLGGATAAVEAVWGTLRQLVSEELVAIEQAQAGRL